MKIYIVSLEYGDGPESITAHKTRYEADMRINYMIAARGHSPHEADQIRDCFEQDNYGSAALPAVPRNEVTACMLHLRAVTVGNAA